ncbi:MAG: DUF4827 domain-containing protein [Bacteroidaceae bacterium]|nr:DUF4827 domain-containing protein [Bacteroidaceae bacterium]
MKHILILILGTVLVSIGLTACHDDESYAEQKEKERKVVGAFLKRSPLLLLGHDDDTLLNIPGINVISQEQFEAQDSMTDVSKNEFVLFSNTGIYMQIVRKGPGERLKHGEQTRVMTRYWEYNILADSLQSTDLTPYWIATPGILDVSNQYGTISASFNTEINGGGAMYLLYGVPNNNSKSVPSGWVVPLSYINLGRQKADDEGIALVRLIVPHGQGTADATSNVYPCFYEISYQRLRE